MHRFFMGLSRTMAIVGGIVLSLLVAIVVLSILGREANSILHGAYFKTHLTGLADWALNTGVPGLWGRLKVGPVNGDYELVQAGMAFTIFAFLPLAQITGGHAVVDVFTSWMPERPHRVLLAIIEIAFAMVLVMIAIQLWHGTYSKFHRHQTTFLLQFPLWWAYAASLFGAVIAALVSVYTALARSWEALTGRVVLHEAAGAGH